ncbi:ComF family protein [Candidatus Saccharibacteria bacterium]|nr:ComF family protein [Candidatus Saccharibacteria bacterium]
MYHALPNFNRPAYIIPLPTISRHIRTRGFDHTYLIAKHLSRLTNYPINPILARAKNTVQVGTNRATRQHQAIAAYALKSTLLDPSATYILFDDVWTTGASMQACEKMLRSAGATNIVFAILSLSLID